VMSIVVVVVVESDEEVMSIVVVVVVESDEELMSIVGDDEHCIISLCGKAHCTATLCQP